MIVAVATFADLLKSFSEESDEKSFYYSMAKAMLATLALQSWMPLQWRAQSIAYNVPSEYQEFVNKYFSHAATYYTLASRSEDDSKSGLGFVDSFDGRLLVRFLSLVNPETDLGISDHFQSELEKAWLTLLNKAGSQSQPFLPLTSPITLDVKTISKTDKIANKLPANHLSIELTTPKKKEEKKHEKKSDKKEDKEKDKEDEEHIELRCELVRPVSEAPKLKDDTFFQGFNLELEKNHKLDIMEDVSIKEENENKRLEEKRRQFMANLLLKHATSLEGGSFLAPGEILIATKEDEKEKEKEKDKDKDKDKKKEKDKDEKKKDKDKDKDKEKSKDKGKDDKKKDKDKDDDDEKNKKGGGANKKGESLRDKIKRENEELQQAKLLEKEKKRWEAFLKQLHSQSRLAIKQIDKDFLKKCEHSAISLEARLHKLSLRMDIWQNYCSTVSNNRDFIDACLVFQCVHEIIDIHLKVLTHQQKAFLLETLLRIGLKDNATLLTSHLGITLPKASTIAVLNVQQSTPRLLLRHMGHLLKRPMSDTEDHRVGFRPDFWQQQLLDVIDNNESALVSAPTSSGKTFISFYCMKKVLRGSDDGLVIFVAPNKQLAHQVKADVYAHFRSKNYRNPPWCLYGEYTSSMWENVETCQVLITTPDMLQTLLTNAKLYATISSRLKYLIVDEVHCIDELDNGALWERMLLLLRCPFLALSATIGNFDEFHDWLQRVRRNVVKHSDDKDHDKKPKKSDLVHKVPDGKYVTEITRWADLQKYLYIPWNEEKRSKWATCRPKHSKEALNSDIFYPIHPCTLR
eukprot:NODE_174_length_3363_cov_74.086420_g5_i1.p1 GENE.NODE_174_length_3363_cov_74.086420_g5_i1~~NODE_174_length_3363_cov_74.086420_g5_i1.p1  ORF type:complete len:802 (-),score=195.98 NODE_174_length_3363_cov_74.086420_g5_i1:4-2409(-)